uniref:C2H2-type domain-containing protein n=1 Tax=Kalanchoe fedtschenkoi TaxID=63787 RepID=A0A7N0ULD1_KALFE
MAAEAGWLFGLRGEEEDENQLRMNMHRQFQQSSHPSAKSTMRASADAAPSTQKKKRTQPDPDAEVIALSPKTLMATNRFICEVCKKGFLREQNLQLHRRGHNLPWKLKQKSTKEVKKKVYLCPEPTCVHHDPARALGDLTGIKKHFSRKHGEKNWKCQKCSKKYAVQSDWKAHSKTCGTKEYRCDCGTLFSRRDSFVTHRAFCDALARENAMNPTNLNAITSQLFGPNRVFGNQIRPHHQGLNFHQHNTQQPSNNLPAAHIGDGFRPFNSLLPPLSGSAVRPNSTIVFGSSDYHEEDQDHHSPHKVVFSGMMQQLPQDHQIPNEHTDHSFFSNIARKNDSESPTSDNINPRHLSSSNLFANQFSTGGAIGGSLNNPRGPTAGLFSGDAILGDQISPSLYSSSVSLQNTCSNASASAHLSATALLQKAAQVGSSCSINGSSSLLRSLGNSLSGTSLKHDLKASPGATNFGALLGDENNKNLHEIMSSLGGGGSTTTSSMVGTLAKGISGFHDDHQGENNNKLSFGKLREEQYSKEEPQNLLSASIGGCDRLTRDFLGIGQIVRQMSGGFSENDMLQLQRGHQMSSKTSIRGSRDFDDH